MPFEKGKSGNPNGRKSGAPNRVTSDLRQRILGLLDKNFDSLEADIQGLEPRERVNAWVKLLEYVVPKLQRTETVIDLSKLSDAEIDTLFETAMLKSEGE
ncbi:MAG: hypothetical protein ABIQ93_15370 [Saprospiraceae bacterium]